MGQGQSSSNGAAGEQEEAPLKRDYYELLGVERTATDEEIKKAYRRKALELHPDRNYGNEEGATRLFAEVQAAHEVLSDPQERAWYDSHRDILLRGDGAGADGEEFSYDMRMTTADEVLKLMMKFNKRMEYSDAPSGFFGGLQEFFQKLAKEEDIACQWQNLDYSEYPIFGSQEDDYEDVVKPFYASWSGFATKKSFSWKDQYRLSDAPDRRIRRLMEKENQKLREEAIQEFNDSVRSLVAFVRKRDPRVQNNQRSEAERQKALRDAAAAQAARSRAQRQKQMEEHSGTAVPDWAQSRAKDVHEGTFSSESETEEHEYECVVCDKTFKSEAQFNAHEKSKKHIKAVKELKKDMRKQGHDLDIQPKGEDIEPMEVLDDADINLIPIKDSNFKTYTKTNDAHKLTESEDDHESKISNKGTQRESTIKEDIVTSNEASDDDYAPRKAVEERILHGAVDNLSTQMGSTTLESTPAVSDSEAEKQPKLGKAKQKRAKKAAQMATNSDSASASAGFKCAVCQAEFPSKTRLFNHIKEKDHAAPVAQIRAGKGGKGKKR